MNAHEDVPTARDWLLNYAGDSDWRTQVDRVLAQHRAEILADEDDRLARLDRELRGRIEHEKAGKARWRARAEKAEAQLKTQRAEVLHEAADLLMAADETAAALLVDRLREGGDQS